MGMSKENDSEFEKYKSLQKNFCIDSSTENLKKLFEFTLISKSKHLAEEFIKLCSISTDKTKFDDYLLILIKEYPDLGVKYYDEVVGFQKAQNTIEKYFARIEMVI